MNKQMIKCKFRLIEISELMHSFVENPTLDTYYAIGNAMSSMPDMGYNVGPCMVVDWLETSHSFPPYNHRFSCISCPLANEEIHSEWICLASNMPAVRHIDFEKHCGVILLSFIRFLDIHDEHIQSLLNNIL